MQNIAKTLMSGFKTLIDNKIRRSIADWNQNDTDADNYIKHRTHWEEEKNQIISLLDTTEHDFASLGFENALVLNPLGLIEGKTYQVIWDGKSYDCTAYIAEGPGTPSLGNDVVCEAGTTGGNGEPFFITDYEGCLIFSSETGVHSVEIIYNENEVIIHKLDKKYLPDDIASLDNIAELHNEIVATQENVDTFKTETSTALADKMDTTNPVGTGSFSLNRKSNSTVGTNSFAVGDRVTASGTASHAEGKTTKASGDYSHTEGGDTQARGGRSHAEGDGTIAYGTASHAEGRNTYAIGDCSHVEGSSPTTLYTSVRISYIRATKECTLDSPNDKIHIGCFLVHGSGYYRITGYNPETLTISLDRMISQTKGFTNETASIYYNGNIASGYGSHVEGVGTISTGDYSHVQGIFNVVDSNKKYADIIGNGESGDARSNAHTVQWDGTAWYQGDVYVGSDSGTNMDAGSRKLMKEPTYEETVNNLIEADLLPAIYTTSGAILTDQNGNVVLRY